MLNPSTLDVRVAVEGSDSRTSEEGSANVANETANAVDGKDIESIVDSEKELDLGSVVRASSANSTKDNSSPRRDVT